MADKIYLRELDNYIKASDEEKKHPLMAPDRCFDLSKLPETEIRDEFEVFIRCRGQTLTPLSIKSDMYPFNQLRLFLSENYPDICSFEGFDLKEGERKCKAWLLKNSKNLTQKRVKTNTGKTEITDSDVLKYLRKIVAFFNSEEETFRYDSDIWYMKNIPISLRDNPTKKVKSINFKKIPQENLRMEVKQILYIHLSQKALGTVMAEVTALNRFAIYLSEQYPEVISLHDIDRELMEEYLAYTNTEATGRKSYSKELHHLKTVLNTAANVLEDDELDSLFYIDDIGNEPERIYKVYSDAELKRLNAAIVSFDSTVNEDGNSYLEILDRLDFTMVVESAEEKAVERCMNNNMQKAIYKLPELEKKVIFWVYFENMKQTEVATMLGKRKQDINKILNRAYKHLMQMPELKNNEHDEKQSSGK